MTRRQRALGLAGVACLAVVAGLKARDGEGGAVVRFVPLTQGATAVVLDGRIGHGFIVTAPLNGANSMGRVSMIDTRTGRLLRVVGVRWNPIAVVVDRGTGRVFVANNGDSSVSMLDAATGRILRTIPLSNAPQAVAMDEQHHRAFVTWSDTPTKGGVGVIDTRTGQLVRVVAIPYSPGALAADAYSGRAVAIGAAHGTGRVSIIDASTDHPLHILTLNQTPRAVAVSAHTHRALVVGQRRDGLGEVSLVDVLSGRPVGATMIGRSPAAVTVDDTTGHALIVDPSDRRVSVVDVAVGRVLGSSPIGPGAASVVVDTRRAHAVVTSAGPSDAMGRFIGRGSVSIIDARDGHVLRTFPMNGNPLGAAIDEGTGRAFVALYGGVASPDAWTWAPSWVKRWLPVPRPPATAPGGVSIIEAAYGVRES